MVDADQWNPYLYDQKHAFVSKFGESLVDLLNPIKGESILDLGCGTGDLAFQISGQGVNITGVDQSSNMIEQAKRKYPDLAFHVCDAIQLQFVEKFDAFFSNATLHWIHPPEKALQNIYTSLKHGGRLVAEFGGKGNVQTITKELVLQFEKVGIPFPYESFPWYFPSIGEYTSLMEQVGFRVMFAQHFDRPTPLDGENGIQQWLQMFGGTMFENIQEDIKETIIQNVQQQLKNTPLYQDGHWLADYKRIRVIGIKE
ncbi:trans-aconitate methyltransferase [Oikeobacillus pervagus]|uniref:Trans-aconitate methyltransferase n=1 Tax=Oikeobacillus pervagus TaxID=1325931 RepID=A0AAJ1T5K5_9BACI|nr:class I SAM-dependent methyltransferase [Oikeobacillus pervagus]MDQ0216264.1 trans-aconitate methyltransferase [Oikeobacillus pervagus]